MSDKTKIYLDACIFVACFHKKHPNHKEVKNCLKILKNFIDLDIYASYWSVNEMIKVLRREYHLSKEEVDKIAKSIFETSSIEKIPIIWVDVDSAKEYTFREFFDHVISNLTESRGDTHLADAIHSVIMINNKLENILTTNGDDFKGMGSFTPIEPKVVNVLLLKSIKSKKKPKKKV